MPSGSEVFVPDGAAHQPPPMTNDLLTGRLTAATACPSEDFHI